MPAAEPAHTGDDVAGPPQPGHARIIPLAPHRTHGRNAAADRRPRGGPDTMPQPSPQDGGDEAILRPLAEMIERSMVERHLTLADPRTADAVDAALGVAVTVMGGAHAQGVVDEAQREQLAALLEGVRRAARLAADD